MVVPQTTSDLSQGGKLSVAPSRLRCNDERKWPEGVLTAGRKNSLPKVDCSTSVLSQQILRNKTQYHHCSTARKCGLHQADGLVNIPILSVT